MDVAQECNALAAAHERRGECECQQARAIALADGAGAEIHPWRTVAPEPDRLRDFPFALADEKVLGFRRLPPIDSGGGIFVAESAELPEALAHPRLAAAVNPE